MPDDIELLSHRDGVRPSLRIRPLDLDDDSSLAAHPQKPSRHAPNVLGDATPLSDSDDELVKVGEEREDERRRELAELRLLEARFAVLWEVLGELLDAECELAERRLHRFLKLVEALSDDKERARLSELRTSRDPLE